MPRAMLFYELTLFLIKDPLFKEAYLSPIVPPNSVILETFISEPSKDPMTMEELMEEFLTLADKRSVVVVSNLNFAETRARLKNVYDLNTCDYFLDGMALMIVKDFETNEIKWIKPEDYYAESKDNNWRVLECLIFKSTTDFSAF